MGSRRWWWYGRSLPEIIAYLGTVFSLWLGLRLTDGFGVPALRERMILFRIDSRTVHCVML